MSGIRAVVPVKRFSLAKQRLAPVLDAGARSRLARAMLQDVLAALAGAEGLAGTLVVSAEPEAAALARAHGADFLAEPEIGLNAALTQAARHLSGQGAAGLLVLPGDLPGLIPAEVTRLVRAHSPGRGVSLVAAHDGEGTNALLASPPVLIPFAFGPGSLDIHRSAAAGAGVAAFVHEAAALPGIGFDVDVPADLARLGRLPAASRTRALLAAEGLLADTS